MTTCIYVENVLGSGQVVKLVEDFGDYSVCRNLQPGDNARLIVSPFKSIRVQELPFAGVWTRAPAKKDPPLPAVTPRALVRRG